MKLLKHDDTILIKPEAVESLFNSPIKPDLYFINTTQFIEISEARNPILRRDNNFGMVPD